MIVTPNCPICYRPIQVGDDVKLGSITNAPTHAACIAIVMERSRIEAMVLSILEDVDYVLFDAPRLTIRMLKGCKFEFARLEALAEAFGSKEINIEYEGETRGLGATLGDPSSVWIIIHNPIKIIDVDAAQARQALITEIYNDRRRHLDSSK